MPQYTFTVSEEEERERLDALLGKHIPEHSRSFLSQLIRGGSVTVNGTEQKASYRTRKNDILQVTVPEKSTPDILPEEIALDILYEDEDILIVNKPKGMVVHPAAGHAAGTLVNAVMAHCRGSLSGINGVLRPGIVHRIDKDTTGSVIVCKNDAAHRSIADQLREHSLTRRYYAIVYGTIPEDNLTIHRRIGRDPKDRKKMAVVPPTAGKDAITHVHVLERFRNFTYVECRLETGRTHQIRVHMASAGHPVLGDSVYAGARRSPFRELQGQTLHAGILGFRHPVSGEYIETQAPLPAYFEELLRKLRAEKLRAQ
ncbi:RluA family pseudouridine synthase [Lachnoclostridium sp. Marseille-P6806]|uniref:RluA family pseudouridine synthase n=1 Tax=Lachnoclostridium sp. Marseille-P6806 TaxID=2364793 RepID=UPI0010312DA7|nr:RluA family pseudouridine synthase [Lachnoclostridium sp. Marseille-P6806]